MKKELLESFKTIATALKWPADQENKHNYLFFACFDEIRNYFDEPWYLFARRSPNDCRRVPLHASPRWWFRTECEKILVTRLDASDKNQMQSWYFEGKLSNALAILPSVSLSTFVLCPSIKCATQLPHCYISCDTICIRHGHITLVLETSLHLQAIHMKIADQLTYE